MILTYGDTSKLADTHWYMVELRSERTVEGTLKRMATQLANIFREGAVELFIPVLGRDLGVFELKTGNYVFARSNSFRSLLRLKSITGVVGLVTLGDSNHPSKAIPIENSYVQEVIEECYRHFLGRATAVKLNSFVRILDGEQRDFCGHVIAVHDGMACVRIDIKTKLILVETPVRNLLDLNHVPANLRVFYYSPAVAALENTEEEHLVAEDLHFEADTQSPEDGFPVEKSVKHGRQQTVTALVKRLILTGTREPRAITVEVIAALKQGSLRSPKNLSIVHGLIKHRLIVDHFAKLDPTIVNYRDVVVRFGAEWRFPLEAVVSLAGDLPLPISNEDSHETGTPDTEPVSPFKAKDCMEAA